MMTTPDDRLDAVLRALADAARRALLDRLRDTPGLTLTELAQQFPRTRQALSKHLALLEDAELVVPVWRGREKLHFLNPAPLHALPARWITATPQQDSAALLALQRAQTAALATHSRTAAGDPVLAALEQPPSPLLGGQPVTTAQALAAAIDYLGGTGQAVQGIVETMAPRAGYQRPADGGFSLVEHLWHLADLEMLGWHPRFERILSQARPRLPGVDGDRLAVEQRYQARPWRAAARRFVARRRRTLAALARFDAATLRRPVVFAGQPTRAGSVVAAAVAHDLDHRAPMAACWRAARS